MTQPATAAPTTKTIEPPSDEVSIHGLKQLSTILDTAIRIPGTNFRVGLDGLIGLIPGAGDAIGALFSGYIIYGAARIGAPAPILAKMVGNVALEVMVGVIPILGDLFDFAWKANTRNMALLTGHLQTQKINPRTKADVTRMVTAIMIAVFVALAVTVVVSVYFVIKALAYLVS